jgi:hypothetical protein
VSPAVNLLRREADHSPSSTAEVKNVGATPPFSHTPSQSGAKLINHRITLPLTEISGLMSQILAMVWYPWLTVLQCVLCEYVVDVCPLSFEQNEQTNHIDFLYEKLLSE